MAPFLRGSISRLLDECKNMKELKHIHAHLLTSPFLSTEDRSFLTTRLLFFCATSDSGSLSYATAVFRLIQNPNLFAYNAMIRAHANKIHSRDPSGSPPMALILYKQMLFDLGISPDCLTFPFLVKECAKRGAFRTGRGVHAQTIQLGFDSDLFVQNSLISFYSASGFLSSARYVFDEMLVRDVVSWNSMIMSCLRTGDIESASDLFSRMSKRSIFTWNSMITGLAQAGQHKEALELFHEMQTVSSDQVRPDKMTVASVLAACSSLGAVDHGKWVHNFLERSGLECDVVVGTALVDMYGKCGCVETAFEVFKKMPRKDILAWTAMISVFALHGHCDQAFELLKEMESAGVRPNHVTFVGLLSACAHSGSVEKGRWCFKMMWNVYSIQPQAQHYACMVHVLSRAGLFDEAETVIGSMPMDPDVFVWGALFAGCQMHGNVDLGVKVAKHLIQMDPLNHAYYVNLSDIYARAGHFDSVRRIKVMMEDQEIQKPVPGYSMIEVEGEVYEFTVTGSSEVSMDEVVSVLNGLYKEMKRFNDLHEKTSVPWKQIFSIGTRLSLVFKLCTC